MYISIQGPTSSAAVRFLRRMAREASRERRLRYGTLAVAVTPVLNCFFHLAMPNEHRARYEARQFVAIALGSKSTIATGLIAKWKTAPRTRHSWLLQVY